MNLKKYRKPPFLKKENCEQPTKFTIAKVEEVNVRPYDEEPEFKVGIHIRNEAGEAFRHTLNDGNFNFLCDLFSEESESWIDQTFGFRWDPAVEYNGKVTGGFRAIFASDVPEPKKKPTLKRRAPVEEEKESLPF
jgi:hypothetical protein